MLRSCSLFRFKTLITRRKDTVSSCSISDEKRERIQPGVAKVTLEGNFVKCRKAPMSLRRLPNGENECRSVFVGKTCRENVPI